jgi:hypothetical protein
MPTRRNRNRGEINQSTRSIRANPDRIAAKRYVDEIKELRKVLKAIQKKYRDANTTIPKNLIKIEEAQNELRLVDFPELPEDDNISKQIKPSERWGIIATAFLWRRPLDLRRRLEEYGDRMNAVFNFQDFKNTLNHLINPMNYNRHEFNVPNSDSEFNENRAPLVVVPRLRYGQSPEHFSSPYDFPPSIASGTVPDYSDSPPPIYRLGGSKKKYNRRTKKYKRTNKQTNKRSKKYKKTKHL